jgi:SPP1 gp7 family putative phage head morphogenesis protein
MPQPINERLRDTAISHHIAIQKYGRSLIKKAVVLLNEAEVEMMAKLEKATTIANRQRAEAIIADMQALNKEYTNSLKKDLKENLTEFGAYEAEHTADWLQRHLPVVVNYTTLSPEQLFAAVEDKPIGGELLNKTLENLGEKRADAVAKAVRLGFIEGESIPQLIQRVRGTRKLGYTDGVLETSRHAAEAIVRTAVNHTSNVAREMTYTQNEDLIDKIQLIETLDNVTCVECGDMDGEVYPMDEGPRPPHHINCRGTFLPIIKSWKELGFDLAELPEGTRQSMDGEVPESVKYSDWLKGQPKEVIQEALGKTKAELFTKGGMEIRNFIDRNGGTYTLKELKQIDAAAFERAGLTPNYETTLDYVMNAKTGKAVTNEWKKAETYAKTELEIAKVSYKGMAKEDAAMINRQIEDVYEKYPELKGQINSIAVKNIEKEKGERSGKVRAYATGRDIVLNEVFFAKQKDFMSAGTGKVSDYHVDNTGKGTITHEIGHVFNTYLAEKSGIQYDTLAVDMQENVVKQHFKERTGDAERIARGLSTRATLNSREFFAEAFVGIVREKELGKLSYLAKSMREEIEKRRKK